MKYILLPYNLCGPMHPDNVKTRGCANDAMSFPPFTSAHCQSSQGRLATRGNMPKRCNRAPPATEILKNLRHLARFLHNLAPPCRMLNRLINIHDFGCMNTTFQEKYRTEIRSAEFHPLPPVITLHCCLPVHLHRITICCCVCTRAITKFNRSPPTKG